MKIKTYGVKELTEWHGKVKAGSIEVAVSFTGGTASPSGAQPAYFVTKDPITQFVIENSGEFKNGFITLLMSQEIPGNHPRMAVPKAANPSSCPIKEAVQDGLQEKKKENPQKPAPEKGPVSKKENGPEENQAVKRMEFASTDDAKDYLEETFGVVRSKMLTKDKIVSAGNANGVEIVIV